MGQAEAWAVLSSSHWGGAALGGDYGAGAAATNLL